MSNINFLCQHGKLLNLKSNIREIDNLSQLTIKKFNFKFVDNYLDACSSLNEIDLAKNGPNTRNTNDTNNRNISGDGGDGNNNSNMSLKQNIVVIGIVKIAESMNMKTCLQCAALVNQHDLSMSTSGKYVYVRW